MGANDPRGGAIFDPRGMVGRIYKEHHYTLLHTALGFVVSEKKTFYVFSNEAPGVRPVWPRVCPRARLAGFIKRTNIHCYTQNGKALGLVVLSFFIY